MHLSTSTGLLYLGVSIGAALVISSLIKARSSRLQNTRVGKNILLAHIVLCFFTRVILITIHATLMTIDAVNATSSNCKTAILKITTAMNMRYTPTINKIRSMTRTTRSQNWNATTMHHQYSHHQHSEGREGASLS